MRGEIAFGRQPIARPQRAALDERAHVRHHLLRAAFAGHAVAECAMEFRVHRPVTVTTTGVRSRAAQLVEIRDPTARRS